MARKTRRIITQRYDRTKKKLEGLERGNDRIFTKMIEAGADTALPIVETELQKAIGRKTKHPSQSTGELKRTLECGEVKKDRKNILSSKISFKEPRSEQRGVPKGSSYKANAFVANILEYGKKDGTQAPSPWLKPGARKARPKASEVMQRILDEETRV